MKQHATSVQLLYLFEPRSLSESQSLTRAETPFRAARHKRTTRSSLTPSNKENGGGGEERNQTKNMVDFSSNKTWLTASYPRNFLGSRDVSVALGSWVWPHGGHQPKIIRRTKVIIWGKKIKSNKKTQNGDNLESISTGKKWQEEEVTPEHVIPDS